MIDTPSAGSTSATPTNKNIVYINLDGGKFSNSGNQEEIFCIDVNTIKTLFKTSDIEKDGYALKGFRITDGAKYLIQGEDIILLSTDYIAGGITMTAIWEQNIVITSEPTIEPANNSIVPTMIPTQVPTSEPTSNVIIPTIVPTQVPIIMPTIVTNHSTYNHANYIICTCQNLAQKQ